LQFLDVLDSMVEEYDAFLSMACGVGVQTLAEQFPSAVIYPALNTKFMGRPEERGTWSERCYGCGNCVLDKTLGGINTAILIGSSLTMAWAVRSAQLDRRRDREIHR
jgi:heme/copper-type cytochrome/quinol oxidase subunit 3